MLIFMHLAFVEPSIRQDSKKSQFSCAFLGLMNSVQHSQSETNLVREANRETGLPRSWIQPGEERKPEIVPTGRAALARCPVEGSGEQTVPRRRIPESRLQPFQDPNEVHNLALAETGIGAFCLSFAQSQLFLSRKSLSSYLTVWNFQPSLIH